MQGNRKPFILLLIFILVFISFIWIFTSDSDEQIAIKDVAKSTDLTSVKNLWDENNNLHKSAKFSLAIRKKIHSLNLNDNDLKEVMIWLPPATDNLNIIVIPDLSKRTANGLGKHNQVEYDTAFIHQIWKSFQTVTRTKVHSKDRLVIDVADQCQTQGQFKNYADNLTFDLFVSKDKSTALFFKNNSERFYNNVSGLYKAASNNYPAANNYIPYFNKRLPYHLKKSSLEDRYRNIVFILSDGYMEEKTSCNTSQLPDVLWNTDKALENFASTRDNSEFKYPIMREKFPDLEVYVFEIDQRKNHEEGLIYWWETWLNQMEIKKSSKGMIFPHIPASNQWKSKIHEIINS